MRSSSLAVFDKGHTFVKIPITLTVGRLFISPIFLFTYLYYGKMGIPLLLLPYILLGLLTISEVSDFLDGFLARKLRCVTDLGKILDPMADSIVHLTVILSFTQGVVDLPLWLGLLFLYRDILIGALRTLCAFKGVVLAARKSGKIKTALLGTSLFFILLLMIPYSLGKLSLADFQLYTVSLVGVCAAYTVFSGAEYIYANRKYIKQAWRTR